MYSKIPLLLLSNLLFLGCKTPLGETYSILSDNPQMALVTDLYNTFHPNETPFIFRYASEINLNNLTYENFDIVVGKNLTRFEPYFKNTRFLIRFLPINYQEILKKHKDSFETSRLLPLAFDLPIVLSTFQNPLPIFLDLKKLDSFKDMPLTEKPPFMAFSPFENKSFLWYWSLLMGVDWRKSTIGDLSWDEEKLKNFLEKVKNWTKKDFYIAQQAFLNKYAYLGEVNLLKRGYISISFSRLSQWRNYYMENEPLSYSFLTNGQELIALQEDTTYLALSLFSSPKEPIKKFMRWITSFEGQKEIVKELKRKSPYFYGFLNSFSFLKEVNWKVVAGEYPELAGRLPDVDLLRLSYPLPYSLSQFLENTWYPWLEKQTSFNEVPIPLEQAIQENRYSL